jgi:isopenicillin N synthase-like dioxygenase
MHEMAELKVPIIDISALISGDVAGTAEVAQKIGAACRGIGFFYIKGHGVSDLLMKNVFAASAAFFEQPLEDKRKVLYSALTGNRGYVPMKGEALDPSKPSDLKEAFNIGFDVGADDAEVIAGVKFRAPNLWPEQPGFRNTMLAYYAAVWQVGKALHRAFAIDLSLLPTFFENKLDRPMAILRLLHYPPRPEHVETGQLGAGAHTDYGCVTLLATDMAGGLQVQARDGTWLEAPPMPGAFICNIGDCLMRWTNDTYVSTPHRVVNPSGRERYSVAFFLDPNPEAMVACLPTCSSPENPSRYPAVRGDDYLQSRLEATYAKGGLL